MKPRNPMKTCNFRFFWNPKIPRKHVTFQIPPNPKIPWKHVTFSSYHQTRNPTKSQNPLQKKVRKLSKFSIFEQIMKTNTFALWKENRRRQQFSKKENCSKLWTFRVLSQRSHPVHFFMLTLFNSTACGFDPYFLRQQSQFTYPRPLLNEITK